MTDQKYKNILREILEEKIPNTKRRDFLIENEQRVQEKWDQAKAFEIEKGEEGSPKYLATFPYPYMNGRLHLGHVFTISKACFATFYYRLKGKRSLFPFSFHCTGMPIKACADKLKRELEEYGPGGPPPPSPEELEIQRNKIKETLLAELEGKSAPSKNNNNAKKEKKGQQKQQQQQQEQQQSAPHHNAGEAYHSNKSKAAAKSSDSKTQWDIMRSLGLTDNEIVNFTDPLYWLHYFPPHCKEDLRRFGAGVDWRRSFITTDVNPYYDSFVRWQFETLRDLGKIKFGKRYSIYSPLDGQPCLDHDRSSGENVLPQDYTCIKLLLLSSIPSFTPPENFKVYLVAATLRPETMYGQTNCWVKPDGVYGAFQINDTEIFICADRAARNMAFQELSPRAGEVVKIAEIRGEDLIGTKVKAPLTSYEYIYTLPMLTVSMNKGTGIVTSVPSDSPDDFAALRDLKSKPALREKYSVTDDMVMGYEPLPIISTSKGNLIAPLLVDELKIKSQNDSALLAEAKEKSYLLGFYEGVLLVGDHQGEKVESAKDKIKGKLISEGHAIPYSEPEKPVTSRSGDDCVVALVDQWFLVYGESSWKEQAQQSLKGMNTFHEETRHMFEKTLGWLNQWACSRSFGLGSRFPWDPQYLIESLSDSTIYMAYYTIAHLIQGDINGKEAGSLGIPPEQFTNAVWDFIFLGKPIPDDDPIKGQIGEEKLKRMREEFEYWYPLDLRVSGKDLIPNHLTFAIYNHVAIFPQEKWIKGIRANGHLLLNKLKMSKNTGNFLTLYDSLDLFGADATRFALAEAGDTLEDANFSSSSANKSVLTLYNAIQWAIEIFGKIKDGSLAQRPVDSNLHDRTFDTMINFAILQTEEAYEKLNYRDALLAGFFELRNARDEYRTRVGSNEQLNGELIHRYLHVQALLMLPIVPHWSEFMWELLYSGSRGLCVHAEWPAVTSLDRTLLSARNHIVDVIDDFRKKIQSAKGKPSSAVISIATQFPAWHLQTVDLLRSLHSNGKLTEEAAIDEIKKDSNLKKNAGNAMPLARDVIGRVKEVGDKAFEITTEYNEMEYFQQNLDYIQRALEIEITLTEEKNPGATKTSAIPLRPVITFPKAPNNNNNNKK